MQKTDDLTTIFSLMLNLFPETSRNYTMCKSLSDYFSIDGFLTSKQWVLFHSLKDHAFINAREAAASREFITALCSTDVVREFKLVAQA